MMREPLWTIESLAATGELVHVVLTPEHKMVYRAYVNAERVADDHPLVTAAVRAWAGDS